MLHDSDYKLSQCFLKSVYSSGLKLSLTIFVLDCKQLSHSIKLCLEIQCKLLIVSSTKIPTCMRFIQVAK